MLEADHHHTMITRAHTCVVVEVEVVVVDDQTVERQPSVPAVDRASTAVNNREQLWSLTRGRCHSPGLLQSQMMSEPSGSTSSGLNHREHATGTAVSPGTGGRKDRKGQRQ